MMLEAIKTEDEYDEALAGVYNLMQLDIADGSAKLDELEALSIAIEVYEAGRYLLGKRVVAKLGV